eukprot:4657274-Pyramimonas_sp.AAC.1
MLTNANGGGTPPPSERDRDPPPGTRPPPPWPGESALLSGNSRSARYSPSHLHVRPFPALSRAGLRS